MDYDQLENLLTAKSTPHVAGSVEVEKVSSIRFLDMNMSRKGVYEEDCRSTADN